MRVTSYKEFVEKALPEEKRIMAKQDLAYYLRPISNVISIPLVNIGVSATAVTKFSLLFPILGLVLFIAPLGSVGFWGGWIAIFIWNVLDGVDGSIARYTGTSSVMGGLWDATVGWIAMIVFFIGMGFTAYYRPGIGFNAIHVPQNLFLILGCFTAICIVFPRLVMHKKNVMLGDGAASEVQDRTHYGLLKLVALNLNSINGVGAFLFALAYLLDICGICMICYFLLNALICLGSLYNLLLK